jgi:hypothetical protein
MRALPEENLIGADAGILSFVKGADRRGCRLVMSGAEISGLVSLSDLQKLPVRATVLFALITHAVRSPSGQRAHERQGYRSNLKAGFHFSALPSTATDYQSARRTSVTLLKSASWNPHR